MNAPRWLWPWMQRHETLGGWLYVALLLVFVTPVLIRRALPVVAIFVAGLAVGALALNDDNEPASGEPTAYPEHLTGDRW